MTRNFLTGTTRGIRMGAVGFAIGVVGASLAFLEEALAVTPLPTILIAIPRLVVLFGFLIGAAGVLRITFVESKQENPFDHGE